VTIDVHNGIDRPTVSRQSSRKKPNSIKYTRLGQRREPKETIRLFAQSNACGPSEAFVSHRESHNLHVGARIIAATYRDLRATIRDGTLRVDLLYRLNVFPIEIPPELDFERHEIRMLLVHKRVNGFEFLQMMEAVDNHEDMLRKRKFAIAMRKARDWRRASHSPS